MTIHTACTAATIAVLLLGGCDGRNAQPAVSRDTAASPSLDAAAPAIAAEGRRAASLASTPADIAQLSQQVEMMRRELADMRLQLAHMPGSAGATPMPPDPRVDPNARVQADQAERLRIAASEAAFRSEPLEPGWSRSTTEMLRGALLPLEDGQKIAVHSIECRSRTCRVEIGADPLNGTRPDFPLRSQQVAQALPNLSAGLIDLGDGQRTTVLYLSR